MLAVCLTGHAANAGYQQYFYSGFPTPIQPSVQYQQYQAPVTYQSYVPVQQQHYIPQVQTYNAFPAFPTPQHFGYQQSFPQQFIYHTPTEQVTPVEADKAVTTPGSTSSSTTTSSPSTTESESESATTPEYDDVEQDDEAVITNAVFRSGTTNTNNPLPTPVNPVQQNDNFRGFAYQNEFEGGRSHFVFITGPEANRFPQSQPTAQDLPSRTSASDAVDTVATKTASTNTNDHSLDALIQYLEHPQAGVQRFYSINNALVSRRVEDEIPALPAFQPHPFANVRTSLPITQPISPLFPILRSSFQLDVQTVKPVAQTENKEAKEEKEEHQVSASNIETKSVAPETTIAATSTTTASTTAAVTEETVKISSTTPSSTTTTAITTEKAETSTKEEKSTMGTIIVE